MNRVPIVLFNDRAKAQTIRQRLIKSGLNAEFNDSPGLPKLWFVSRGTAGVRIEVPEEQFASAEQLLLDWDEAEGALRDAIRCPECGSLRVEYPQYAKNSLLTNLGLGLLASIGFVEKDYYCEDCHFTWPKQGVRKRRDRSHLAPFYFIDGVERTKMSEKGSNAGGSEERRKAA
jgi:hypothetical protein